MTFEIISSLAKIEIGKLTNATSKEMVNASWCALQNIFSIMDKNYESDKVQIDKLREESLKNKKDSQKRVSLNLMKQSIECIIERKFDNKFDISQLVSLCANFRMCYGECIELINGTDDNHYKTQIDDEYRKFLNAERVATCYIKVREFTKALGAGMTTPCPDYTLLQGLLHDIKILAPKNTEEFSLFVKCDNIYTKTFLN